MYSDMSESNPKSTIRTQIDENLKRIYDETLQEQIPDRLTLLLEQLRAKGGQEPDDDKDQS
jgi:Anti-sigma factor NepR